MLVEEFDGPHAQPFTASTTIHEQGLAVVGVGHDWTLMQNVGLGTLRLLLASTCRVVFAVPILLVHLMKKSGETVGPLWTEGALLRHLAGAIGPTWTLGSPPGLMAVPPPVPPNGPENHYGVNRDPGRQPLHFVCLLRRPTISVVNTT